MDSDDELIPVDLPAPNVLDMPLPLHQPLQPPLTGARPLQVLPAPAITARPPMRSIQIDSHPHISLVDFRPYSPAANLCLCRLEVVARLLSCLLEMDTQLCQSAERVAPHLHGCCSQCQSDRNGLGTPRSHRPAGPTHGGT